jgi:hypothetical protein
VDRLGGQPKSNNSDDVVMTRRPFIGYIKAGLGKAGNILGLTKGSDNYHSGSVWILHFLPWRDQYGLEQGYNSQ